MELAIKVVHLYFIPYYITNLCLIYDSNNLITYLLIIKKPPHFSYTKKRPHTIAEKNDNIYLFWSSKNTINFFECSSLIYIKYVKSIGCVMVGVLSSNVVSCRFDPRSGQTKTIKLVFAASPLCTQH
jgi:hypothetical protein